MTPQTDPDLLKIGDAAEILGVTRRTIYRRIWSGDLPASKVGGLYFIRRADLDALLIKGRTKQSQPAASAAELPICARCLRRIENDDQIGELCQAETCEAIICEPCWQAGGQYCRQHDPHGTANLDQAQAAFQRGELQVLVRSHEARLREINFIQRIQGRVQQIDTLIHPLTEEALTVENWGACHRSGDERLQIMKLLGKMMLDAETVARQPLNAWVRWDIPAAKSQQGRPLRIEAQALSRLPEMLRDACDTRPLDAQALQPRLLALSEQAEHDRVVCISVFAATSGWSPDARLKILGEQPGSAFVHPSLLVYLFDLQSGELIYNLQDDRQRGYADLFSAQRPAENLAEIARAIEAELTRYDSLSLQYAQEILPYSPTLIHQAFVRMAESGKYTLTQVPGIGEALVSV